MKALSASLVVFSGCLVFGSAPLWQTGDGKTVAMLFGGVVAFLGMIGWWQQLHTSSE